MLTAVLPTEALLAMIAVHTFAILKQAQNLTGLLTS